MSSRKVRLKLSPAAQQDVTSILQYTGERWGHGQLLAGNTGLGHHNPELPATHRLYFVGSHVIVYRTRGEVTEVVRILHQRMSVLRHV